MRAHGARTSTQRAGAVESLERRAYRLRVADGLTELLAAGLFTVVAAAFLTESPLAGFIGLSPFVMAVVQRRLRARVSDPRIGYVELPDDPPDETLRGMGRWAIGVLALTTLGVALTGGIGQLAGWRVWSTGFIGMFTAGGFLYLAQRSGYLRYRLVAGLSAVLGVGLAIGARGEGYRAVGWWALVMAAVLLVQGAVLLVVFMRRHPRLPGDQPEPQDAPDAGGDRDG